MKIRFYLDKTITKKEGHPLRLYIYVSSKDRKYPFTQYSSLAKDWDFIKEEPKKSHPLYTAISDFLYENRRKILKLLNSRESKTSQQIENYLLGNSDSIYDFWEERIKELEVHRENRSKTDLNTGGTAGKYSNNLSVFKAYKEELMFSEINYNFLYQFKLSKSKTCSPGGINSYLANLRAVYKQAIKRGLYTPESFSNPFEGIMETTGKTKDKYLTIDEMKILKSNPIDHDFYRYFMLCFYLGGLDFIDIASLKKSDIKNNRIKFIRFKGGTNELIDNSIFEEAKEIINYFEDPDSDYLTPIHKFSYKPYRDKYVREIRKKFKKLGIESYVDSKSPRYTFINIGSKELYLNRDIVKELTGHSQNDTHSIYEGKFPYHVKDKVHKEIIDSL
ncbi:Site-specific recombinase XerD [Chryseobacterium oranimense]|uniref:Site-specific recombinase XerD n=1 Tax=Chryseobacterium oranimense TaxID=421058 RepID=A0A1M5UZQ7_9FLAO|nr:phage integrase SAM-like domain-containing protein [Chryseobacterium oranimense]SHH68471.1 Site-specific recombinase XerD [Chryseobacterium oranimense]